MTGNSHHELDGAIHVRSNGGFIVEASTSISARDSPVHVENWKVLLFGQFLSFLLAAGGAAQATLHYGCSLSAPTFSSGLFYTVLSLNLILLKRQFNDSRQPANRDLMRGSNSVSPNWFLGIIPIHTPSWTYFLVALIDVEANYFTVLAFRFTTLSSVSLFDALAIPTAMLLSRFFLGRQHGWIHMMGICCCMIGVLYNAMADYESDLGKGKEDGGQLLFPHKLRGDALALLGGILFGANDVVTETLVRNVGGPLEYLGMMGFFATVISLLQGAILERDEIFQFFNGVPAPEGQVCTVSQGLGLISVFVIVNVLSYTAGAFFLCVSEATFLNLSLLTGDLWSVVFMVAAQGILPQPLFWAAFTMIAAGVTIYEVAPNPIVDQGHPRYSRRVGSAEKVEHQSSSESGCFEGPNQHEHIEGQMAEMELL